MAQASFASPIFGETCRYWLARVRETNVIELVDGCHGDPEGVAKAAKLMNRIFSDNGPWIMVELRDVPDLDPPINEDAAAICAQMVDQY